MTFLSHISVTASLFHTSQACCPVSDHPFSPDHVMPNSTFERAVAAVGTDYLAHPVWDKYLAFEEEQAALMANRSYLIALYSRVLTIPQRDLDKYYQG